MSETNKAVGAVNWIDLTIDDADSVKDFYRSVVGWDSSEFDMGGYSDYCMNRPSDGGAVAGVCHARGGNAGLPAQWLIYINVENLDASVACCEELGGKVIKPAREMPGQGRYCVIQDPAGAVSALFEHAS